MVRRRLTKTLPRRASCRAPLLRRTQRGEPLHLYAGTVYQSEAGSTDMSASKVVGSMLLWFRSLPPSGAATALCGNGSDGAAASGGGAPPAVALQRLHAEMRQHTDEVGWLTAIQEDVEDQSLRVRLRLARAKQDLAAGRAGAGPVFGSEALRAIQEQVTVLEWQQRALGERRQQVAQRLQEALRRLAGAQGWLGARAPGSAPAAPRGAGSH